MCFMFGANKEQVRRALGLTGEVQPEPAAPYVIDGVTRTVAVGLGGSATVGVDVRPHRLDQPVLTRDTP